MTKPKKSVKVDNGRIALEVRSDSINMDSRTVEVIFAAGAAVRRWSWDEGFFMEELSMDRAAVRLERLNAGAAFLDTHDSWSMGSRLGAVVPGSARIEGGKGYATVKFSRSDEAERILQDTRDGIPLLISVGYKTHRYEKIEGDGDKLPILRATDWEPMELSAVPIPADPGAHARSEPKDGVYDVEVVTRDDTTETAAAVEPKEVTMTPEEIAAAEAARVAALAAAAPAPVVTEVRAAPAAPAPVAVPAPAAVVTPAVDQDAIRSEERARVSTIMSLAVRHGLTDQVRDAAVTGGTDVQSFRNSILDGIEARQSRIATAPMVDATVRDSQQDEVTTRREAMTNALLNRSAPARHVLTDAGRQYRGLSLIEMAREALREQGVNTRGMTYDEISRRSFMSTSDFPIILENVTNRTLMSAYEAFPQTFKPFCRQGTARDFKEMSRVRLGGAGELLKVNESGEFKRTSLREGKERYAIATYGRIVSITRQVLINDDLGALTDLPSQFGQAVSNLESDTVWGLITANAELSDGKGIFHADHGNIAAAAAFGVDGLAATRLKMTKQVDLDGKTQLNLRPKFVLLPSDLELKAEQLLGSFQPNVPGSVTPESMRKLTPIVEGRLSTASATAFYLVADPGQLPTIEYSYLEGNEGPYTESRLGFDVDGLEVKVRLDFGAAPLDYRGFAKNAGA